MNLQPPKHFKGTIAEWHKICSLESWRKTAILSRTHKPNIVSRRTSKTAWKSHDIVPVDITSNRGLVSKQRIKWKGWKK